MARAYGRLPHEILALDFGEFATAAACMLASDAQASADIKRGDVMAVMDIRG